MMRSPFRLAVLPLATLLLGAVPVPVTMRAPGSDTPDDRRDATRRAGPVPLTILAVVGGKALDERGEGECKRTNGAGAGAGGGPSLADPPMRA